MTNKAIGLLNVTSTISVGVTGAAICMALNGGSPAILLGTIAGGAIGGLSSVVMTSSGSVTLTTQSKMLPPPSPPAPVTPPPAPPTPPASEAPLPDRPVFNDEISLRYQAQATTYQPEPYQADTYPGALDVSYTSVPPTPAPKEPVQSGETGFKTIEDLF